MSAPRQNLFSIGPSAPFLPTLAEALVSGTLFPDWPREGPFRLSDVTVFLPTRRARAALAEALVAKMGDTPSLLPDIRALGGEDPEAEPFLPPYDESPPPPAVDRVGRRLMLSRLVGAWLEAQSAQNPFSAPGLGGFTGAPHPAEILALADSLGTVIDDFEIARLPVAALDAIVPEALAGQWQQNLDFLKFVLDRWSGILAEAGEIEAAARTNILLDRQAGALGLLHGDRPVVVAGSTGSIPATAGLIAAIARLPRGAVVLPGLETGMPAPRFAALLSDQDNPHGHPQYGLARLLKRLDAVPALVTELAPEPDTPRTRALSHALALPGETALWAEAAADLGPALLVEAARGVSILAARTPEEEARAVAILARERLEAGGTVAIVSPDQTLARRIRAELARFSIPVDDAAGTPLALSRAGRLARQAAGLTMGGVSPVDAMALLRDRHVTLGMGRAALAAASGWLDLGVLRGQRPAPGIAGLRAGAIANREGRLAHPALKLDAAQADAVLALLDALEAALSPLLALAETPRFSPAAFVEALADTLSRLRAPAPGDSVSSLEGEAEWTRWAQALVACGPHGPALNATSAPLTLSSLLAGQSVRPPRPTGSSLMVFGRLEARLMTAGTVILSGLVEGVWPEVADPGPWLSRSMRLAAGLEPPEKLHGLAAHDFLMASGAPDWVLTHAGRAGTGPATPSRLLQRLEGFFGPELSKAMRARGHHYLTLARRLDLAPGLPRPAPRPAPRPPAALRPKKLSITEAETLLRSPYDLYAKYVLGLRPIPALGADPDFAERGAIVHEIFGRFVSEGYDPLSPQAPKILENLAEQAFSGLEAIPARRDIWMRRFAHAASAFLGFEAARAPRIAARHAEIGGDWTFPVGPGDFRLTGRADRIDLTLEGAYEILDFKTGAVPEAGAMRNFLAPQLPLEAVMANHGGFSSLAGAPTAALAYIKIANGPEALAERPYAVPQDMDLDTAVDTVFRRFSGHAEALLYSDRLPMPARILPNPRQRHQGDYDHLARTAEWTLAEGGEEE